MERKAVSFWNFGRLRVRFRAFERRRRCGFHTHGALALGVSFDVPSEPSFFHFPSIRRRSRPRPPLLSRTGSTVSHEQQLEVGHAGRRLLSWESLSSTSCRSTASVSAGPRSQARTEHRRVPSTSSVRRRFPIARTRVFRGTFSVSSVLSLGSWPSSGSSCVLHVLRGPRTMALQHVCRVAKKHEARSTMAICTRVLDPPSSTPLPSS